jgi:hypothetical protein
MKSFNKAPEHEFEKIFISEFYFRVGGYDAL